MGLSILEQLARATPEERQAYIATLDPDQLQLLVDQDWSVVARPEQLLPDGDWLIWLIRAGRGYGKTRTGAEGTKECILQLTPHVPEGKVHWGLGAPRREDVIGVQVEGESGLLSVLPPSMLVNGSVEDSWNKSDLELTLETGAVLHGLSGRVADSPRGQNLHGAWVDEPATLPDASRGLDEDTFMSNLLLAVRLLPWNRIIITGTPRNVRLIKDLRKMANAGATRGLVETIGRTRDNLHNLSEVFKRVVVAKYAGTRLGRQELDAEILEGVGVMFARGWFQVVKGFAPVEWQRVRMWDLAATEESDLNADPDWSVGVRVAYHAPSARYHIEDVVRVRELPGDRDRTIRRVAEADRHQFGLGELWAEQEGGSGGKSQIHYLGVQLDGVARVRHFTPGSVGSKAVRAQLVAGPAQQQRVYMTEADWNLLYLDEHEEFHPDPKLSGAHDDQVDATSAAFAVLSGHGQPGGAAAPTGNVPDLPRGPARMPDPGQFIGQAAGLMLPPIGRR